VSVDPRKLMGGAKRKGADMPGAVLSQLLRSELRRCLGMPGQAPSYKLGERTWLQARQDAMARAGAAFSFKEFHAKALSLGAMGLDPLREALARI
jgi:uncharacterized protein (DUF885 family)